MEPAGQSAEQLRRRIAEAEDELKALREQLAQLEAADEKGEEREVVEDSQPIPERQSPERRKTGAPVKPAEQAELTAWKWPLSEGEYERYGRQLILPQVGIHGMLPFICPQNLAHFLCFFVIIWLLTVMQARNASRHPAY